MIAGAEHCGPGGCKLRIAGVSKVFDGRRGKVVALEGINLNIRGGEFVCLGDRVVLLTPHPGRVCEEYFVDFPHPRDINSSDLAELSARITRDLKGATA